MERIIKENGIYRTLTLKRGNTKKNPYILLEETDTGLILWNVLSLGLFYFDSKTKDWWNQEEFTEEEKEKLIREGFLIEEKIDARELADQINKIDCVLAQKRRGQMFNIFTTTLCNARCWYCFEKDFKNMGRENMSDETAMQVAKFIINIKEDDIIYLRWFGGEPLMNIRAIDIICNKLREENIKFRGNIVTNAYLLTKEVVEKCKCDWNITNLLITIDGREKDYNSIKNYKTNDPSPYKRVIANIKYALESGINITLALNHSRQNHEELIKLIPELKERFGERKNLALTYPLIIQDEYNGDKEAQKEIERIEKELNEFVGKKNNERLPRVYYFYPNCPTPYLKNYQITTNGKLGRCQATVYEEPLGDIWGNKISDEDNKKWQEDLFLDKCNDCEIYPVCHRLRLCPSKGVCTDYNERKIKEYYKRAMINEYILWKEKLDENETKK